MILAPSERKPVAEQQPYVEYRPIDADEIVMMRLLTDYKFFARNCLWIVPREGGAAQRFVFNDAQEYFHWHVEMMSLTVGLVRIKVVKGRQQGISTYIIGRGIWEAWRKENYSIFILSHETKSTHNLFGKIEMFYNMAPANVRPGLIASNKLEKSYTNGSKFIVATANSEETGRSYTAQFLHRSERAFYKRVLQLDAGLGQVVAYLPGTYIFDESTGNGQNHFYKECMDAQAGKSLFKFVFIPWYWEQSYRIHRLPENFELEDDEPLLKATHGLDDAQVYWRRMKILELGSIKQFRQEFPFTVDEAFQQSGDAFFDSDRVTAARKSKIRADIGAVVIGCDPARQGDRTVVAERRGREGLGHKVYKEMMKATTLAGILSTRIDYWLDRGMTVKCFIDVAMGYGTWDIMTENGYGRYIQGIHFGEKSAHPQYFNKRVEMAFLLRDWLEDDVSLPDDDAMAVDFAAMPDSTLNSTGKHQFPAKEEIKAQLGHSPDILDAYMLTFAQPVLDETSYDGHRYTRATKQKESELTTRRRMRDNSGEGRNTPMRRRAA